MGKNTDDFFKEKKEWSKVKDDILGCYLKPYFTKIQYTKKEIIYIDGFSGKGKFDDKEQEYFYCLYLDNRKKLKKKKLLFIGTINYSVVHPREIFKEAYMIGAVSIIIIHNHPTGDVNPSHQDIETTKKIIEVGKLLGIKIDDHVIVGQNNYYSFFENGLFD